MTGRQITKVCVMLTIVQIMMWIFHLNIDDHVKRLQMMDMDLAGLASIWEVKFWLWATDKWWFKQ